MAHALHRKQLLIITIICFLVIVIKLFHLQVLGGKRYLRLAEANRIRKIYTPAPRGKILDRHNLPIADSRPAFAISVIPCEMDSLTITNLMRFADIDDERIKNWINDVAYLRTPIKVKRNIDIKSVLKLEENSHLLPGVSVEVEPVRVYPNGSAYAHTIGYLSDVSPDELQNDTFYKPWHYVGRAGIELQYEKYLRGVDGIRYTEIDASGREIGPIKEKREILPSAGYDVQLTIDVQIQNLAYELISKYKRGAVVGIDLSDGGILCLLSYPGFDPELMTRGISATEWQKLISNKSSPLINRTIGSAYPPGSTIKPILALQALEKNLIDAYTRFTPCQGSFVYGNRTYRCLSKHGSLNLSSAIVHSCNIYFYQLGLKLGVDNIASFLQTWHIDDRTGIDLIGERKGNVPSRKYLDNRYGKNRWTTGLLPNFAVGQGEILTTPLQLASIYAAIANNGVYYTPHLLKAVKNGDKVIESYPVQKQQLNISDKNISIIKQALKEAVEKGTGGGAYLGNVTVAGKTGTAENPPNLDHAWFVGYAPAENPQVLFCVIVENVGKGGAIAAPIVRELIRKYFEEKNRSVTHE
ncbi:MAG: penicillin-binding protein 2 [Candidatus Latescibacteria bacterium]|nr:penicillin-binding protein 2 [Candidatus Latescibacterota bacterium]